MRTFCLFTCLMVVVGCKSEWVTVREMPKNPLEGPLNLMGRGGPQPTERTEQFLRRYDLKNEFGGDPQVLLAKIHEVIVQYGEPEAVYAYAELAYVLGKKEEAKFQTQAAFDLYGAAVAHAYMYLQDDSFAGNRNPYDPHFRRACDLYNGALECALRIAFDNGQLKPGETQTIRTNNQEFQLTVKIRGAWKPEDFDDFKFANDYEVGGLTNKYREYGLGVPLIAVRNAEATGDVCDSYYPPRLSFPVTAFLRVNLDRVKGKATDQSVHTCVLELYDPLETNHVEIAGREVPLESDLSTPLAFFLNDPAFSGTALATLGLLAPEVSKKIEGLYMLEPYNPRKIPVLMVHGLWSTPVTWTDMYNDLRANPEIRENYQFWFYLYPSGQPFWISAAQLRTDLAEARRDLNSQGQAPALDHMVLLGHSMGGLVSRLQTIESNDDFWHIISEQSPEDLVASDEDKEGVYQTVFFQPNPHINRVVTLATPHRGSEFANDITRWLSHKAIALPRQLTGTKTRLIRDNPGFFRDSTFLTTTTSLDSLSPDSPILPVMRDAEKADWVTYHNVVGVVDVSTVKGRLLGQLAGTGDGVVRFDSAHMEDVSSEIQVAADHSNVHRHPRAVLEVRRILDEHVADLRHKDFLARQQGRELRQVGFDAPDNTPRSTVNNTLENEETRITDQPNAPRPPVTAPVEMPWMNFPKR